MTTLSSGRRSVTGMCIDDVQERLVGSEPAQVLHEERLPSVRRLLRAAADVGREQQARLPPGRVVGRRRLRLEDVEAGPGEPAVGERGEQSLLVERLGAADVDDERGRWQGGELRAADDALCLV